MNPKAARIFFVAAVLLTAGEGARCGESRGQFGVWFGRRRWTRHQQFSSAFPTSSSPSLS